MVLKDLKFRFQVIPLWEVVVVFLQRTKFELYPLWEGNGGLERTKF